jgi:DNA-binding beta-propeller fold protein YncE
MRSSSKLPSRVGLVCFVLVCLGVLFGTPSNEGVRAVDSRFIDGASRLVSVDTLGMNGAACAIPGTAPVSYAPGGAIAENSDIPVNPVTVAMGMARTGLVPLSEYYAAAGMAQQQPAAEPAPVLTPTSPGSASTMPKDPRLRAVASRKPIRTIRDRYPQFSAVAVDPTTNEVVIQDENLFQIQVYDRTTNTPRTAAMSEPKRSIQGVNTYLELNCALYIDPKTGNIYSLNNDTERSMTVWDRNAKGDVAPIWKLRTPMGSFGLAVDEEAEELLITAQHEQVVAAYSKTARDDDPPKWVLWGDKTEIADPHGIAIDPKEKVFFVANFGSTANPKPTPPGVNPLTYAVARGNIIPGSGRYIPPAITVYPLAARGNTAPIRNIRGPNTQLNWPAGLYLDPERSELFVANDGGASILVFDTKADGNTAPKRVLKGPATKLRYPTFVFIDFKNDELWVADMGSHRVMVFPRAASGNAAPIREIRSAPDGTPSPTLANVRIGYDTKRDQILAPN